MDMIQLRILTQGRLSGMIWVALTATTSDLTREGQREMRPSASTSTFRLGLLEAEAVHSAAGG